MGERKEQTQNDREDFRKQLNGIPEESRLPRGRVLICGSIRPCPTPSYVVHRSSFVGLLLCVGRRWVAQLVLKARDDLLEEPCEADQLHAILGRLGRSAWDTEAVIARAVELWHTYPPDSVRPLPNWVLAQTKKRPPLALPATSTVRAIAWPVAAAVLSASAVLIYSWLETTAM